MTQRLAAGGVRLHYLTSWVWFGVSVTPRVAQREHMHVTGRGSEFMHPAEQLDAPVLHNDTFVGSSLLTGPLFTLTYIKSAGRLKPVHMLPQFEDDPKLRFLSQTDKFRWTEMHLHRHVLQ